MKRLLSLLPLGIAVVIGIAGWWGLTSGRYPSAIPSVLIDQPVPDFTLPAVAGTETPDLSTGDLMQNEDPVLVNFFASWCLPCRAEHAVLVGLAQDGNVTLAGINYKDKPETAARWLDELGNPYWRIGSDVTGRTGLEWGVSGVPETFIVGRNGQIVFRHVGPISGVEATSQVRQALAAANELDQ